MSTQTDQPELPIVVLPPRIERRMAEVARRVYLPQHQVRLYEEHLTDDEVQSLFDFLPADAARLRLACEKQGKEYRERSQDDLFVGNGFQNVIRLAGLRNMIPEQLILDLALEFGLLHSEAEHNRLVSHFCGEDRHYQTRHLCYADGELRLGRRVIRKVKKFRKKSKVELILDSFQEVQWKQKSLRFADSLAPAKLADAVKSLNKGLSGVQFHTCDGGESVSWEIKHID